MALLNEPTACQIPTFTGNPRWLVELGDTPAERYYGDAPDEETAIKNAQAEHARRQSA